MREEIKVEDLKKAAGGFATGVTIITSKDEKSVVNGMDRQFICFHFFYSSIGFLFL